MKRMCDTKFWQGKKHKQNLVGRVNVQSSKKYKMRKIHKCAALALVACCSCALPLPQPAACCSNWCIPSCSMREPHWTRRWRLESELEYLFHFRFFFLVPFRTSPVASTQTTTAHECQAPTLDYIYLSWAELRAQTHRQTHLHTQLHLHNDAMHDHANDERFRKRIILALFACVLVCMHLQLVRVYVHVRGISRECCT